MRFPSLVYILALALSGCAALTDQAKENSQVEKSPQIGSPVENELVRFLVPDHPFYPVLDQPRKGFISLRSAYFIFGNYGSYSVYPFEAAGAASCKEAWRAHIRAEWPKIAEADLSFRKQEDRTWKGSVAWYHEIEFAPKKGEAGFWAIGMVVKGSSHYYWIVRSHPMDDRPGRDMEKFWSSMRTGFEKFSAGVELKQ